mmetsp:Transcript_1317/g.3207  ORF Transcript_1317/g.3207 Transcript_1317/m.3207 type:complete len:209 (+) Transcript_1317:1329-1955(+)
MYRLFCINLPLLLSGGGGDFLVPGSAASEMSFLSDICILAFETDWSSECTEATMLRVLFVFLILVRRPFASCSMRSTLRLIEATLACVVAGSKSSMISTISCSPSSTVSVTIVVVVVVVVVVVLVALVGAGFRATAAPALLLSVATILLLSVALLVAGVGIGLVLLLLGQASGVASVVAAGMRQILTSSSFSISSRVMSSSSPSSYWI